MTIAVLVVILLVVVNGLLAMSEMALASSRRSRLRDRAEDGDEGAARALLLYDDPNRFLSTVQIGISLVGVTSGAFGGSALAAPLGRQLAGWGLPEAAAEPVAFGVVVLAITYLSLVIGELVPKRIALAAPERMAGTVSVPMIALSALARPLVAVLSWSTDAILRPFGVEGRSGSTASPEEISGMLEQSRRVGHIGHAEVEMIENVFDLEDRRVRSMLTPRREVSWLDADASWEETRAALLAASHSRLPVARGELDRLVGVVHVHALLDRCLLGEEIDVVALCEEALVVPESLGALALLDKYREHGRRFAVVLDEYGGVEGIVTAGDVLSALLGELADGADEDGPTVERLGEEEFDLDGKLYVEDLKDLLEVPALPREEERDYRTLGGLVTTLAGRIPDVGDVVVASHWRFEVTALDGPRVDRVHVRRAEPGDEGPGRPLRTGIVTGGAAPSGDGLGEGSDGATDEETDEETGADGGGETGERTDRDRS